MVQTVQNEYNDQGKELREHGTVSFPVACYSGSWETVSVPLHWHTELEAGFVTAGQVTLCAGKERILLREGEGFFINTGIPHAFSRGGEGPSSQCSVVFDPSVVGGRLDSVFWQRYVQPVLSAAALPWLRLKREEPWQKEVLSAVEKVWSQCSREEADCALTAREGLTKLLAAVTKHLPAEQPAKSRRILRDNERIRMMMGYIQAHYAQELTTVEIAKSAMISVSEALRCFHACLGLTPIQYVKYYRIQRSAEMLLHCDEKIARIAEDCGFQEMSYYARAFREQMGVTPSQYRKNNGVRS